MQHCVLGSHQCAKVQQLQLDVLISEHHSVPLYVPSNINSCDLIFLL